MRGQERKREGDVDKREIEIRQRVPVSGPRDVLTVYGKDPNYYYRWVNDTGNRVQRFLRGGYEIVTDDLEVGAPRVGVPEAEGSPLKISVGGGLNAYLMRIPQEWYNEDQKRKDEAVDATEDVIFNRTKEEGMYGDMRQYKT